MLRSLLFIAHLKQNNNGKGESMAVNLDAWDTYKPLTDYVEENCFAKIEQVSRQLKLGKYAIERHLKNIRIKSFIEFRRPFIYRALTEYINNHSGITAPELAKHFKVSQALINYHLKAAKIKITKKRGCAATIDKDALASYIMLNPEAALNTIAKCFGVSGSHIWKLIRKFGIPYHPKHKITMTNDSLALFVKEHPELTQQQIASHFKVAQYTVQKHIRENKIPYQSKKVKVCPITFIQHAAKYPNATKNELASTFNINPVTAGRLRKLFPENNFDTALARYIHQHPNAKEEELKKHFHIYGGIIRQYLPNGVPRQWTEKVVEKLLDEWVLQFGDKLVPGSLIKRAKYLHRAFYEFGLYRKYPMHYWKFNSLIYPLFNMDKPKDYEEELQMQWPDKKILHTRYRELLKIHHPDRHHQDPQTARAAHFKFRWIVKAYSHLLKRHKRLTIGEPPPAIKQMSVHPINNGKVISP